MAGIREILSDSLIFMQGVKGVAGVTDNIGITNSAKKKTKLVESHMHKFETFVQNNDKIIKELDQLKPFAEKFWAENVSPTASNPSSPKVRSRDITPPLDENQHRDQQEIKRDLLKVGI